MSEKVIVELNVTKLPIFFLPGKLHLSLENPGPAELDKTQLSPAEKFMLNRASMLGQITLSGAVKSVSTLESKSVEEQKPAPKPQEIKDQVLSKRQEVVEKLQKLSIQELSKEVQKLKDPKVLQDLLALEIKQKKPRVNVVKLIEGKLVNFSVTVKSLVGIKDNAYPEIELNDKMIAEDLEESEQQEIEIKI